MRSRRLLSLVVVLIGTACSQAPETVVAEGGVLAERGAVAEVGEDTTTVPGQRPVSEPSTTVEDEAIDAVGQRPPASDPSPSTTLDSEIEPVPDPPLIVDDDPLAFWQDHPLARVVLTEDDFVALGLGPGWEMSWADFIELEPSGPEDELVCGEPVPIQTSYFVARFEDRAAGVELDLNVMPVVGPDAAADFLVVLELLATCPEPEEQYAGIDMEVVDVEVSGADRSVVISGTDATSQLEPIGMTLAAADVDGHLFMAFVAQDSGSPADGDVALAVAAIERSISRL